MNSKLSTKNILVMGATAAIATAVARRYAVDGHSFFLIARNGDKLDRLVDDLIARGAGRVDHAILDIRDRDKHGAILDQAFDHLGTIDIVLIAHGYLPDGDHAHHDMADAITTMDVNATDTIAFLTPLADRLAEQRHGTIAGISSVAGDRGRAKNYVYGAAKAAFATYLNGLRNRLHDDGVHVMTIKPGFVDTPMTKNFEKGPLWAYPEKVAGDIIRGIEKEKNILYTPWFWRWIMMVIKAIPETLFKRLSI
jgi:short-subunit dehydrogenase